MRKKIKFAPREVFEQILEYAVIPTFDLVIQYGDEGVVIVRRKIAPYKDKWAFPGLRMFKPESIEDTLSRIANDELGLGVDPRARVFLGQYVGRFSTEHGRQDLSTGYLLKVSAEQVIRLNASHFHSYRLTTTVPSGMGAMYGFYLRRYMEMRRRAKTGGSRVL